MNIETNGPHKNIVLISSILAVLILALIYVIYWKVQQRDTDLLELSSPPAQKVELTPAQLLVKRQSEEIGILRKEQGSAPPTATTSENQVKSIDTLRKENQKSTTTTTQQSQELDALRSGTTN